MTNRFVPVLVSVALLISLFATAQSKAYALEIAGVNTMKISAQISEFNDGTAIRELQIVSDEQLTKIPVSAFYQLPVDKSEFKGVSTKFSAFHPGVDFRATLNSDVKPIQKGIVRFAGMTRDGYGNSVIVEHKSGIQTLYAHMGKIKVEVGDIVDLDTVLGTIGMTGHTTGPHLHFEMRTGEESYINPEKVFEELKYTPAPKTTAVASAK